MLAYPTRERSLRCVTATLKSFSKEHTHIAGGSRDNPRELNNGYREWLLKTVTSDSWRGFSTEYIGLVAVHIREKDHEFVRIEKARASQDRREGQYHPG
ncbi:hypothetical protein EMIT0P265_30137 [Pseudomonas zeae]